MNELLTRYLQRQMSRGSEIMKSKVQTVGGRKLPTRTIIVLVEMYVRDFLNKTTGARRWVVIPGLRGVGKTTVLAQLYLWIKRSVGSKVNILYISMDEVVEKIGSDLSDLLDEYERLLPGGSFESESKPTFIFIDEVQVDPRWARTLKFLYDRVPNVFIICSGSSATHLQIDADVDGRRAVIDKLYPLSFPEYQVLAFDKLPAKGLKRELMSVLYESDNAEEVYARLAALKDRVDREWTKYDKANINTYLETGTMPFTLAESDPRQVYSAISGMTDKIITLDMQALNQFEPDTIGAMKRLLMVLTDCDTISYQKMADLIKVSRGQVINIIDAFVKAELLIKVPAHGNNVTATTNPAKFFFMSPAIRAAFHDIVGIKGTIDSRRGTLLEDAAALHFYREFTTRRKGSVAQPYDKQGGLADFILRVANKRQIIIEMGIGTKGYVQAEDTLRKYGGNYGLVFSQSPLGLNEAKNVVTVPLDYFFLM